MSNVIDRLKASGIRRQEKTRHKVLDARRPVLYFYLIENRSKMNFMSNGDKDGISLEMIFDSVADGVFAVDTGFRVTRFNRAAESITGIAARDAMGRTCREVLRSDLCEADCPMKEVFRTGKPVINRVGTMVNARGETRTISISAGIIRDAQGNVIGGVETFRDLSLVEEIRQEGIKAYSCQDILSINHRMRQIFEILPAVAESNSTVLIEGETGTGKELMARAIHNLSPRRLGPFIAVNCGAIPDTLLESELFGYKAGAFTDAKSDKPGRFKLAQGGTIFLDEIGDVSPALQVRLLRVLQERVFEPLGSVKGEKADVRVITATNKNLEDLVEKGLFRKDLYYRLNIIKIDLPPLRERKEDIPILVDHFIARFNRLQKKDITGINDKALGMLMAYDFPGNVRELENIIERAFVLCNSGQIEPTHLPETLFETRPETAYGPGTMKEIEARLIMDTLRRNNWNRLQTARELGMHKSTLFRKIKALGLNVPPPTRK